MEWKQVQDELPPLNKRIILGFIAYLGCTNELNWFVSVVKRPYDQDENYNPNLYQYIDEDGNARKLQAHSFWCEVPKFDHPDLERNNKQ